MKYGTNASHEQLQRLNRQEDAQKAGWSFAWAGSATPYRHGTPEYKAFARGAELAAFDAKRLWA